MKPLYLIALLSIVESFDRLCGLDEKFFSDNVQFELSYYNKHELEEDQPNKPSRLADLYTTSNENYRCVLPEIDLNEQNRIIEDYTGPTPSKLLQSLSNKECFWISETFWNYEFCPGKHVRQFHTDSKKTTVEFFLGYVSPEQEDVGFDHSNLLKVEYRGDQMAYYKQEYGNGTNCDLTDGKPRSTTIMFVCAEEGTTDSFVSITEITSCRYELLFATKTLCVHPAFQRPKAKKFEIKCFLSSADDMDTRKYSYPNLYEEFADDDKFTDFTEVLERRAGLQNFPSKTSLSPNPFLRVLKEALKSETRGEESLGALKEALKSETERGSYQMKEIEHLTLELIEEQSKLTPRQLISKFFNSIHCLTGVSKTGYKISFCHRSRIMMFVPLEGKSSHAKVIGRWSEKSHRAFADLRANMVKMYDENGMIDRVTNFYSDGYLDEIDKKTHVVVKMICNMKEYLASSSTIKMFFMEKRLGEYRLYLESGLLCSYLEKTDKLGVYRTEEELLIREALEEMRMKTGLLDFEIEIGNFEIREEEETREEEAGREEGSSEKEEEPRSSSKSSELVKLLEEELL